MMLRGILVLTAFIFLTPALLLQSALTATGQESPAAGIENSAAVDPTGETDVAEHVSVNDVTSDKKIQSRLQEILQATGWFDDVHVEVRDSVTFLNGKTVQESHKEWAGSLTRNTEGVAAVVNQIEVEKNVNVGDTMNIIWTSVESLWKDFLFRLPLLIAGLLVIVITSLIGRLTTAVGARTIRRSRVKTSLQDLILHLLNIGIWIIGLLVAAIIMFPGMTPSKALAVLGLGSVAVGFAFKDIFENFFAGILILWKYPFDKGDYIECDTIHGKIEEITIRNTMIRQVDGQLVIAPNAMLFKNPVEVLTSRASRRTTILCGVAYDTDLDQARKVLTTAVNTCETVSFDLPVQIFAKEFADSSINFEVTWWTGSTPLKIRESRDEVVRKVKHALDKAGIEIPFPQRTHWFPEPIPTHEIESSSEASNNSSALQGTPE